MDPNAPNGENPYAPPTSDVNAGALPPTGEVQLAERGTRFVSQLVDGLLFMVALAPGLVVLIANGAIQGSNTVALFRAFVESPAGVISILAWVGLIAFQAYLVATTGQSIAKRLFKIKIVKLDGTKVNFVSGVLVRNWLMMVLQQIPVLNMILPLLDALFIFRQDRRCIHDLIAGTKVITIA